MHDFKLIKENIFDFGINQFDILAVPIAFVVLIALLIFAIVKLRHMARKIAITVISLGIVLYGFLSYLQINHAFYNEYEGQFKIANISDTSVVFEYNGDKAKIQNTLHDDTLGGNNAVVKASHNVKNISKYHENDVVKVKVKVPKYVIDKTDTKQLKFDNLEAVVNQQDTVELGQTKESSYIEVKDKDK